MLYAIGRNIMKYHRFIHHEIEKYEGKRSRKQLSQRRASQNPNKGILRPKIDTAKRRKQSGKNPGPGKSLNFYQTVFSYLSGA